MDQLRSLRVFTQVISEGSFAGAARVLDMAPAVVTRAVAELEEHLGVRLLNRTTRKLALTDIGEAYVERARNILAELEEADAVAGSSTLQIRGTLRVLCPPAFAVHQLAPNLSGFRALHPNISLELSTPGPVEVADEHFDVSILSIGQQALEGDFVVRKLATSTFMLCASPGYLASHGHPQHPGDLSRFDGVLPAVAAVRHGLMLYRQTPAAPLHRPTDTWAIDPGDPGPVRIALARPALTVAHIDMMLAAAVAGLGIAGLPSFVTESALRDGRLVRVLPDWRGQILTLYVAMPSRKYVPAKTRAFIDFLVQAFGGEDEDPWLKAG